MSRPGGPFHPGEIEIQRRAGVLEEARHLGRSIFDSIPRGARPFLGSQRMAVVASLDAEGRPLRWSAQVKAAIESR